MGQVDSQASTVSLDLGMKLYWREDRVRCRDLSNFCLVLDRWGITNHRLHLLSLNTIVF